MENRGKRQAASIFGGMGFYIALLVCVVAAGVVGYFALLNDGSNGATSGEDADPIQTVDQMEEGDAAPVTAIDDPDDTDLWPVMGDETVVIYAPVEETADAEPAMNTEPVSVEAGESVPVDASDMPPQALSKGPVTVVNPVLGETVAVFAVDQLMYDETLGDWRTHDGIDLRAAAGSAVSAAAAGTVLSVADDDRMGTVVTIEHEGGYVTTYASLHPEINVLVGDTVSAGTVIGTVGTTALAEAGLGEHVHFSVTRDGEVVDPLEFLG